MELIVNYLGNVQFEAVARGHKILCDQPLEGGGNDEALTPPELLLASLATCAGYYAVQYLKVRNLPSAGLRVKINAEKVLSPARLEQFVISLEAPGGTTPKDLEGIRRAAEKCLVKNTLLTPPSMRVEVDCHTTSPASA